MFYKMDQKHGVPPLWRLQALNIIPIVYLHRLPGAEIDVSRALDQCKNINRTKNSKSVGLSAHHVMQSACFHLYLHTAYDWVSTYVSFAAQAG